MRMSTQKAGSFEIIPEKCIFSYPTLKSLSATRPDVPIYVGDTSRPVFWMLEKSQVQLTNINVVPFGIWQNVSKTAPFE
uniref:Cytidine monophospho-N-acetylneuraminic acid hydroxylase n=1 Tax=Hucho hucho TaxID=62062 RepID=A0A4W5MNA7_9TELE